MDNRMRQSLDSYIMGEHLTHTDKVWHKCPQCDFKREIGMIYDMGGWFYHPVEQEDLIECPYCRVEMGIIE